MAVKKTWYEIVAPPEFGEKPVGETIAAEPQQLVGRVLTAALSDLEPSAHKFYIKINMRIDKVDSKARTVFAGHDVMTERIYRMVQRHTRRVDCIQDVTLKDGTHIRIKTVLVIPKRVGTSIKDAVRKGIRDTVESLVSSYNLPEFIQAVTTDALQRSIKEACKKVYPIGIVEVRKSEVLTEATAGKKTEKPETKETEVSAEAEEVSVEIKSEAPKE